MTSEQAAKILAEGLESVTEKLNGLRLLSVLFPDLKNHVEAAQEVYEAIQLACRALELPSPAAPPTADIGTMVEEAARDRAQFLQDCHYADALKAVSTRFAENANHLTPNWNCQVAEAFERANALLRRVSK